MSSYGSLIVLAIGYLHRGRNDQITGIVVGQPKWIVGIGPAIDLTANANPFRMGGKSLFHGMSSVTVQFKSTIGIEVCHRLL